MIQCPRCDNETKEKLHQHDASLAGYRDYGRFFTCLKCSKNFEIKKEDIDDDVIMKWPDV